MAIPVSRDYRLLQNPIDICNISREVTFFLRYAAYTFSISTKIACLHDRVFSSVRKIQVKLTTNFEFNPAIYNTMVLLSPSNGNLHPKTSNSQTLG